MGCLVVAWVGTQARGRGTPAVSLPHQVGPRACVVLFTLPDGALCGACSPHPQGTPGPFWWGVGTFASPRLGQTWSQGCGSPAPCTRSRPGAVPRILMPIPSEMKGKPGPGLGMDVRGINWCPIPREGLVRRHPAPPCPGRVIPHWEPELNHAPSGATEPRPISSAGCLVWEYCKEWGSPKVYSLDSLQPYPWPSHLGPSPGTNVGVSLRE